MRNKCIEQFKIDIFKNHHLYIKYFMNEEKK